MTIKRDIQEVLKVNFIFRLISKTLYSFITFSNLFKGGHKIPGEEYRPKKSDEKF